MAGAQSPVTFPWSCELCVVVALRAKPSWHRVREMAPKRQASAKAETAPLSFSASSPSPAPKKFWAPAAASSSLLDKQLAGASQHQKDKTDKVVAGANVGRVVQKISYDNFRSFSDDQVFQWVREGQRLFDRLCRDKQRCDAGELTMGKHDYAETRGP